MRDDPIQRSVMVLDVESSSGRSNPELGELRKTMYGVLDAAIKRSELTGAELAIEDRGDGALVVVDVPPLVLLDPLAERLSAALSEVNARVEPVGWLRLRLAVHAGPVHRDAHGWSGDTVNSTFAICDAPSVKAVLRQADRAQLVLAVSDLLHMQVVRHGYRSVNPATYRPVDVARIGERAWVRVPGYPVPPIGPESGWVASELPPPQPGSGGVPRIGNIFGSGTAVTGGTIIGGDQIVRGPAPGDGHG